MIKKFKLRLLGLLFIYSSQVSCGFFTMMGEAATIISSLTIGEKATVFTSMYATVMSSYFLHEVGHATAAKVLFGNPIKIVFGKNIEEEPKPGVHFLGLQPCGAAYITTPPSTPNIAATIKNLRKLRLIFMAGPATGMFTNAIMASIPFITNTSSSHLGWGIILGSGISTISHIIEELNPFIPGQDGHRIKEINAKIKKLLAKRHQDGNAQENQFADEIAQINRKPLPYDRLSYLKLID